MCGGTVFKAASVDAKRAKKYDITGLIVSACRHGMIRKAINMEHGETFTHTHFMHSVCYDLNCRFFVTTLFVAIGSLQKESALHSRNFAIWQRRWKDFYRWCTPKRIIFRVRYLSQTSLVSQINEVYSRLGALESSLEKREWEDSRWRAWAGFLEVVPLWIHYQTHEETKYRAFCCLMLKLLVVIIINFNSSA